MVKEVHRPLELIKINSPAYKIYRMRVVVHVY